MIDNRPRGACWGKHSNVGIPETEGAKHPCLETNEICSSIVPVTHAVVF